MDPCVGHGPTRELSNIALHDSAEGMWRLDKFGEQRSKSGEEGTEESDAKESTVEAPCEEPRDECMDQDYKESFVGDEESNGTEATLEGSCSPASSQGSVCSLHHYSSGHCTGGVS